MKILKLIEEEETLIPRAEFREENALLLHKNFGKNIKVGFPNPINNFHYTIQPQRVVGAINISSDFSIQISPKVPISNILKMVVYAYSFSEIDFYPGLIEVDSIQSLYEFLIEYFLSLFMNRLRKGLFRAYIEQYEVAQRVKGRIQIRPTALAFSRGSVRIHNQYNKLTTDLEDNQIILWTLFQLGKFPINDIKLKRKIKKVYRELKGLSQLKKFNPSDCINRFYHRLNSDYQPIHLLCRFFLEHSTPKLHGEKESFLPFLLNMPHLFETFVAKWLKLNLPEDLITKEQYEVYIDQEGNYKYRIDQIIMNVNTNKIMAVLDTKYKRESKYSESDLNQIVAYSIKTKSPKAFLIYPSKDIETFRFPDWGNENLEVIGSYFDLEGDIDVSGENFLHQIFENLF
jgi:5-methylcytosine-specific restriction enzyme subunit McrC